MNTFHIAPQDTLAAEAAISVIAIMAKEGNGVFVAVRGQQDEDGDASVYCVTEAPHDCTELGGNTEYMWSYVSAAKWLGAYRIEFPV